MNAAPAHLDLMDMGAGPWPRCCGRDMWMGPYGFGCSSCGKGGKPAPATDSVGAPEATEAGVQGALF